MEMEYKCLLKSFLKTFHSHKKSLEDIFLITLPRTGSTLISEIINTNEKVKTSGEPFNLNVANLQILKKYFASDFLAERYTDISPENLKILQNYLSDLSSGKNWNAYYWADFPGKYHQWNTSRTSFKIHKLTYHIDDLSKMFPEDYFIYFLRHPISHSQSRMRNNWDTYYYQYIKTKKIDLILSKSQKERIDRYYRSGSELDRFVISWCLENYIFFDLLRNDKLPANLYCYSYEELIAKPEQSLKILCEQLNLGFSESMVHLVQKPSKGIVHSTSQTKAQILKGKSGTLLSKWRKHITADEEKRVFDILNTFDIDFYTISEDLPAKKYLLTN